MSRTPIRPFLIAKDEDGNVRLTVRETRYNSQGYPLVSAHAVDEPVALDLERLRHAIELGQIGIGGFAAHDVVDERCG